MRKFMTKLFVLLFVLSFSTFSYSQNKQIPIYEGVPKGSETWTQQEREMLIPGTNILLVQNVVKPSLHVFYPPKEITNGTAIIVAPIYGAFEDEIIVPKDAPPIFLAQASDDKVVGTEGAFRFYNAWLKANKNVELHIFEKGGHGFGGLKKNLPVDHWISIFYFWLQGEGFVK